MALTTSQKTLLRQRTGDTNTDDPKVTDAQLDEDYASAEDDLDETTVLVLRRLIGIYAVQVDVNLDLNSEARSQRFEQLSKVLDYWERQTGLSGTRIRIGSLDMNIDTDIEDIT
jgi:hypothetical protein